MSKTQIATGGIADDAVTAAKVTGLGKIGQVESFNITDNTSTTSNSYAATTLTDQITPTSTSSKVLISMTGGRSSFSGGTCEGRLALYRQIDGGGFSVVREFLQGFINESGGYGKTFAFNYLDSPNTTSAVDYKLYILTNANTFFVNSDNSTMSVVLMEILA
tara:strand:- start:209 stop:694 length:486 start_codon:yes stop_codon:yes gene_type:complete